MRAAARLLRTAEGRIRAPWRILLFLVVLAAALGLVGSVAAPFVDARDPLDAMVAFAWVSAAGALLAHWVMLKVERRPWRDVGLGPGDARPPLLVEGTALGALGIGVPSVALVAAGWLRVVPAPDGSWWAEAGLLAMLFLPAALFEELLVRGYAFRAIEDGLGWRWAIVLTSLVFGLLHLRNPGAGWQSTAMVTLAGIFLGGVLLATGSLYAAWLAHAAWNWTMGAALHAPVSGLATSVPDYRLVDAGPDWATGGQWGPEAGALAALAMGGALVYLFTRPRGRDLFARRARREEA